MKKVLMVSYYWPPAGGVSVLRTLKIAKYLRNFGWEPIIYTTKGAHYPYIDKGNLNDLPDEIEVLSQPILEPFVAFKKLSGRRKDEKLDNILQVRSDNSNLMNKLGIWVRANFFIPDARSLWIKPSVKYLSKYLEKNRVDAIFSDGPPHTNTVIANKISEKFNIPWLADFQDPWTQADYYEMFPISGISHSIHSKMEKSVFQNAHKITIASPSWKDDLQEIGAKDVDVIYYGYDESDFEDLQPAKNDSKIIITHAGLLGFDRYPETFFQSIKEILKEDQDLRQRLTIKLVGEVDTGIKNDVIKMGLEGLVEFVGFIPRKSVLQLLINSDLLLLPLNKAKNAKGRLPGKLYEYLRSQTPIIAFGNKNSDAAKIIQETGAGLTVEYGDASAISDALKDLVNRKLESDYEKKKSSIEFYSNFNQTKSVAKFLDQITSAND